MNRRRKKKSPESGEKDLQVLINVRAQETIRTRHLRRSKLFLLCFKGTVIALAAVVAVIMLRHAFIRAFVESEHFTLTHIVVETNGRLDQAQILAATGVREGANLLKLDLVGIEEAARALPQVEEAVVERILPDSLHIRLRERVPVAWISCLPSGWRPRTTTNGLLAGHDGRLFRCQSLAPDLLALPVLDLPADSSLQPGKSIPAGPATAALELFIHLAAKPDPNLPPLVQLAIPNGYTLEATLDSGETAWLSPDEPIDDFLRLAAIIDDFQGRGQRIAHANLLPKKNLAIRLAAPGTPPARRTQSATAPAAATSAATTPEAATPGRPVHSSPDLRAILNRR